MEIFSFRGAKLQRLYSSSLIFLCLSCLFIDSSAQNKLWLYGNQLIDFNDPVNVTISSLPIPDPIPGQPELTYNGAVPVRMSHAEYDHEGKLLFFIVDGRIYNRDGYLLVRRTNGFSTVYDDYKEHYVQYAVCKIPGSCDKFMLFFDGHLASEPLSFSQEIFGGTFSGDEDFGFSIIDLSLPNLFFPNDPDKKGGLVNVINPPTNFPITTFIEIASPGSSFVCAPACYVTAHTYTSASSGDIRGPINFNIYDRGAGLSKWLVTRRGLNSVIWEITPTGLSLVQQVEDCSGGSNDYTFIFEKTALFWQGEDLRLISGYSSTSGATQYSFNPSTGEGVCATSGPTAPAYEINSNGDYAYFVDNIGRVGYVDVNNFTLAGSALYPTSLYNQSSYDHNVKLVSNFYQGVPSIYIFHNAGVDVLKGTNDPTSATFVSNPFNLPVYTVSLTSLGNTFGMPPQYNTNVTYGISTNYFQAPFQVYNYSSDIEQQQGECCIFNYEDEALGNVTVETSQTWTPEDNPYDEPMLLFIGNLVIPSGVSLTLNNMVLRFAENAGIIVEAGGRLITNHSTLTSYVCGDLMWNGIDLLGTTNASNNIAQSIVLGGAQGNCRLENTIIENALCAVEVGTTTNTGGGVLRARNSIFKNNRVDIDFKRYYFVNNSGVAQNMSIIRNCDFLTTQLLNNPDILPQAHIRVQQINKLRIRECDFINSTPLSLYNWDQRRIGIISNAASVEIRGALPSSTNPGLTNVFDGLRVGVLSFSFYQPLAHLDCRFMKFNLCNAGIVNWMVNDVTIVQNRFNIPEIEGSDEIMARERGVEIVGSTGYTLAENDFYGIDNSSVDDDFPYGLGIWVNESGPTENVIERNTFAKLAHGIYTQGLNAVDSPNGAPPGLQFFCNQFEESRIDIYAQDNARIRINQGGNQPITGLFKNTSNSFSKPWSDCDSEHYDFLVDESFDAGEGVFQIDYWCNDAPITRPDCSSEILSLYLDEEIFQYSESCPEQFTTIPLTPIANQHARVISVKTTILNLMELYEDQFTHYENLVDGKQTQQTIQYINQVNSNESAFLRDLLMQRLPLSDQVLKGLLDQHDVVNPNHLAEVLIANSPLSRDILNELEQENILPPFLMYLVRNANGENSIPSLRKMMELQMASTLAEIEKERMTLSKELLYEYAYSDSLEVTSSLLFLGDSLNVSPFEHLNRVNFAGKLVQFGGEGSTIEIVNALSDIYGDHELGRLYQLGKNWVEDPLDSNIVLQWRNLSNEQCVRTSQISRAWLMWAEDSVQLTNPYQVPLQRRENRPQLTSKAEDWQDLLKVWPIPAQDELYLSYPNSERDIEMRWKISNSTGQVVLGGHLSSNGMDLLDIRMIPSGLYILEVHWENQPIWSSKFSKH